MDVFSLNRFVKGMIIVFMEDVYNVILSTKKIAGTLSNLKLKKNHNKSDLMHITGFNSIFNS